MTSSPEPPISERWTPSAVLPHVMAGVAWALVSPDLSITSASADFGAFVGLDDDLVGRALLDTFDAFVGLEPAINALSLNGGEPIHIKRVNAVRPNQPHSYVDLELHHASVKGTGPGLLLIARDTSEVGSLEQALVQERNELRLARAQLAEANRDLERLDQLKSVFLAMAAHDIRTPLVVIRGYAELLLALATDADPNSAETNSDDLVQYISTICVQTDWLENLIENIQGLDQIENDQLVLHMTPIDLGEVVRRTVDILQSTARLNEQTLASRLPATPVIVRGDPHRLQQILHNLIGNGVKYTQRSGKVGVALEQDDRYALLTVSDNGYGIQPEQLGHIFDLYYRTDKAQHSRVKGTGLGLYIVKTLVEAHGGDISVSSTVGQGTRFDVRFPLVA